MHADSKASHPAQAGRREREGRETDAERKMVQG